MDEGIIRCICEIGEDDGFTIQCEQCYVWQHASCVGITSDDACPDKYYCDQCDPRPLDIEAAKISQAKKHQIDSPKRAEKPKKQLIPKKDIVNKLVKSKKEDPAEEPAKSFSNYQTTAFNGHFPVNFVERRKALPQSMPITNSFAEEYIMYSSDFAILSSNRLTPDVFEKISPVLDAEIFLHRCYQDNEQNQVVPNAANDSEDLASISHTKDQDNVEESPFQNCLVMWSQELNYAPVNYSLVSTSNFEPGILGLVAIADINELSFICELKGVLCLGKHLDQKPAGLSWSPGISDNNLLPPFVYQFPDTHIFQKLEVFIDCREYSAFYGRSIRSSCGNPAISKLPNARLVTVLAASSKECQGRKFFGTLKANVPAEEEESPILFHDRVRLAVFSKHKILAKEEIVLEHQYGALNYPCVCDGHADCLVLRSIIKIEDFKRVGQLLESDALYLKLQKRNEERKDVTIFTRTPLSLLWFSTPDAVKRPPEEDIDQDPKRTKRTHEVPEEPKNVDQAPNDDLESYGAKEDKPFKSPKPAPLGSPGIVKRLSLSDYMEKKKKDASPLPQTDALGPQLNASPKIVYSLSDYQSLSKPTTKSTPESQTISSHVIEPLESEPATPEITSSAMVSRESSPIDKKHDDFASPTGTPNQEAGLQIFSSEKSLDKTAPDQFTESADSFRKNLSYLQTSDLASPSTRPTDIRSSDSFQYSNFHSPRMDRSARNTGSPYTADSGRGFSPADRYGSYDRYGSHYSESPPPLSRYGSRSMSSFDMQQSYDNREHFERDYRNDRMYENPREDYRRYPRDERLMGGFQRRPTPPDFRYREFDYENRGTYRPRGDLNTRMMRSRSHSGRGRRDEHY